MKKIEVKSHTNNIVSKANILIVAKGFLSSTSQKMLASIISMLRVDDTEFTRYALNRKDYLKLIGSTSNNDRFLKNRARELMENPFEIAGCLYNWCSKVDIVSTPGYIVFDIHSDLKPYLLELKNRGNFTQYKIVNILSLRGEYTPKFYEYITMKWNKHKKYNKQNSYTFELNIEYIREILQVPKSYRYSDIKRRILNKSVKQFKEKTDIQISFEEEKIGRKVDKIIITVSENNKGSNDYLKTKQAFISYMREHHINADLLQARNKDTDKEMMISVAPDGKLYDKKGTEFDSSRSDEIWIGLYNLAKKDKLDYLKQK